MHASSSQLLDRAAALLDAHPDYRVLRALPSPDRFMLTKPQGKILTAAVIDTETVGLDVDHPIIDLAIQRIAFDEHGRIVRLGRLRQWFEDPGMPIPTEIVTLTGIRDADVSGQRIDDAEAVAMIAGSDVAIAHNASFDAPRIERRLPSIAKHPWACSCSEVPWPDCGLDGRKLGHLLMQCGWFHQGHRAGADVWATINLLAQIMPDGETPLYKLIRQATRPTLRIEATHAPFAAKNALKARGYRWNATSRVWAKEIDPTNEADERGWLAATCGCPAPVTASIDWHARHRDR